jgi:hypothetical protein
MGIMWDLKSLLGQSWSYAVVMIFLRSATFLSTIAYTLVHGDVTDVLSGFFHTADLL